MTVTKMTLSLMGRAPHMSQTRRLGSPCPGGRARAFCTPATGDCSPQIITCPALWREPLLPSPVLESLELEPGPRLGGWVWPGDFRQGPWIPCGV